MGCCMSNCNKTFTIYHYQTQLSDFFSSLVSFYIILTFFGFRKRCGLHFVSSVARIQYYQYMQLKFLKNHFFFPLCVLIVNEPNFSRPRTIDMEYMIDFQMMHLLLIVLVMRLYSSCWMKRETPKNYSGFINYEFNNNFFCKIEQILLKELHCA